MLEALMTGGVAGALYPNSGPGPKRLTSGDIDLGYFGTVSSAELFTTSELTTAIDYKKKGIIVVENPVWMKFAYKGKFLFIPRDPLMSWVSWADQYQSGIVYGTDDDGIHPYSYPVNQLTLVNKGTDLFKVRMIKGFNADPFTYTSAGDSRPEATPSEWNDLLYRVSDEINITPKWENYSKTQLGLTNTFVYVQEKASNVTHRGIRGYNGIRYSGYNNVDMNAERHIWKPVLELIDLSKELIKPRIDQSITDYMKPLGGFTVKAETNEYILRPYEIHYSSVFINPVGKLEGEYLETPLNQLGGFQTNLNGSYVLRPYEGYYNATFITLPGNLIGTYSEQKLNPVSGIGFTVTYEV